MLLPNKIFIAATNQHVGKTTVTLGLIDLLQKNGIDVGFCKPVGQEYVEVSTGKVDKDIALFSSYFETELISKYNSPVILGPGVVNAYIDRPQAFDFESVIMNAAHYLEYKHDYVVYEGTGHTGVGNVVGLSNAKVAQMLGAPVVLVAEAGIGSTLDQLIIHINHFQQFEVPIMGVILNKTLDEKREKVMYYVGKMLRSWGIPFLGALPHSKDLCLPKGQEKIKAYQEDKIKIITQNFSKYIHLPNFKNPLLSYSLARSSKIA